MIHLPLGSADPTWGGEPPAAQKGDRFESGPSGTVAELPLDRRQTERLRLTTGSATLRWSEVRDGRLFARRAPVAEFSADGVGLRLDGRDAPMPTGGPFSVTLEIEDQSIDCLAETRHQHESLSSIHSGLRLSSQSRRADLVDLYLGRRFPQLIRRRDADPDRVHDLFERSGYLALRGDIRPLRSWFSRADDDPISRDVVFRGRDGELVGHVSFTRAYPRAWLGHQLATLRSHREAMACRRAIYLHIAAFPSLVDGDDAMMVGYYDRRRPWHQRFFSGFVDWLRDPALAVTFLLDRFERDGADPPACPAPDHVDVGAPLAHERAPAAALVRAQLSPLVAAALDIHPDRLTTDRLNESYAFTRYQRGRHALVLRMAGELAGVALCETGSRELSLFNLFNMAQVFVLPIADIPAQLALLAAVRAFYSAQGERNPMIVSPPRTLDATRETGTVLAETMGMIVWSGRALRQYENFVQYQFGRLLESVHENEA
jgi:hypothetical protein